VGESRAVSRRVTVESSGFLTRRHRLSVADQEIGELVFHWLTLQATFTDVQGRRLLMRRTSFWRREYEMQGGEHVQAAATGRPFHRRIQVDFGFGRYELQPANLWGTVWQLTRAEGNPVLTLVRRGWHLQADVVPHTPVPGDLLVFTYYLLITRWREARRRRQSC
jgi:hypothetical protein